MSRSWTKQRIPNTSKYSLSRYGSTDGFCPEEDDFDLMDLVNHAFMVFPLPVSAPCSSGFHQLSQGHDIGFEVRLVAMALTSFYNSSLCVYPFAHFIQKIGDRMAYDEMLAARVRDRVSNLAGLDEKKMFGGVGFLLNGKGGIFERRETEEAR